MPELRASGGPPAGTTLLEHPLSPLRGGDDPGPLRGAAGTVGVLGFCEVVNGRCSAGGSKAEEEVGAATTCVPVGHQEDSRRCLSP